MSQRDNFFGGFLLGAIVGGVAGGVLGAVVASRLTNEEESTSEESFAKLEDKPAKPRRRSLRPPSERSIEMARRGLEDKIAQLNDAIDNVRQQLSSVNGTTSEDEEAIAHDS